VHGLWTNSVEETLDLVEKNGVNFIQIPLSVDNLVQNPNPQYINYDKNPDLK
jgi:aryl-phospho-beta-D-glucosidase BglC (GH1 family)